MFMKKLSETLNDEFNISYTENGAKGFETTGKNLLDLNFAVSSLRRETPENIINMFSKAYFEDKELAIKWLFYVRDIRGGIGERRIFRIIFSNLCKTEPKIATKIIKFIPEYGRWDDLLVAIETPLQPVVIDIIRRQLHEDIENMKIGKSISLLAKWLPSINTSSRETVTMAKFICKRLYYTPSKYRKTLSRLRRYLGDAVVETKISKNKWSDIDYQNVSSGANLKYNYAFSMHDKDRRQRFLQSVEDGKKKINSGTLFPHDIAQKYIENREGDDPGLEAMWKSLNYKIPEIGTTIVVADGSGSMTTHIGNTGLTCLTVANSLAIYFSERTRGNFANKYITFSNRPRLVDFSTANSLREKLIIARNYNEVQDTNIEAVFNLILITAIKGNMKQKDIPSNILILSDMEFNDCANNCDQRIFNTFKIRFEEHGYKLPKIIFWNLCSRTHTIPLNQNELGVALISGFSPNSLNLATSAETDPYKMLVEILNSKRYSLIGKAIKNLV